MHNSCRCALVTIIGAITLAAATIVVGFNSRSVFERREGVGIDRPTSSAALPSRNGAFPAPYSANRS
jgi:hypothetical protein